MSTEKNILAEFGTEELLAEIGERESRKSKNSRPRLLENPDYSELLKTCELIFDEYEYDGYSKDAGKYIYEVVLECLYGQNVFNWVNENSISG